jgi:ribosomal protein S18 acetylase RimI-like enzyme
MDVLANAAWHALNGPNADVAECHGRAARYDPDVSVFAAMESPDQAAWDDLAELIGPGGVGVLFREGGFESPAGWQRVYGGVGVQMVLERDLDDIDVPEGTRTLTVDDVPAMTELIEIAEPGPWRPRTIELGNYIGVFADGRLLAMAGQRMTLPSHVEISAVCTHPDARRRGYAAALTAHVGRLILAGGRTPMLHVAQHNTGAQRVYEVLGFVPRREVSYQGFQAPGG